MPKPLQQPLSDRFRGALLGAALGEILGANCQIRQAAGLPLLWLDVDRWGFEPPQQGQGWGMGVVQQTRSLIQHQTPLNAADRLSLIPSKPENLATPAGVTLHLLPLMLFHHEDWQQLCHLLNQAYLELVSTAQDLTAQDLTQSQDRQTGQTPETFSNSLSLLSIGYAISLVLRNQFNADRFLPHLLTQLDIHTRAPNLAQQLEQVQTWLKIGAGLSTAKGILDPVSVFPEAIALYSFLNTPQNFQIAVLRAARLGHSPQITCALTGALCGAHQGIRSLPLNWRRLLRSTPRNSALSSLWQISHEASLLQLADQLQAAWSGVHNPSIWQHQAEFCYTAAPNVIRPR